MSPGKIGNNLKDSLHWDLKTIESGQGISGREKIYHFILPIEK